MKAERTIFIWRDVPPDVEKGCFNYLSQFHKIICVSFSGYPKERIDCGWESKKDLYYDLYILSEMDHPKLFIASLFQKYPSAINIIGGLRSHIYHDIKPFIPAKSLCLIFTEGPTLYGNSISFLVRKILSYLLYRYLYLLNRRRIAAILTFGQIARNFFNLVGFPKKYIYPFMYVPHLSKTPEICVTKKNDVVSFLYIGRFDKKVKGIDILIKAVNNLPKTKKWTLDLVGGYGDFANETIEWAKNNPGINYLGSWNQNELPNHIVNYDVCIVPSKYDGWNLTPNYAIQCGIPIVISDNAGSDELIENGKCGFVFHSSDYKQLCLYMSEIIENPELLDELKKNCISYKNCIDSSSAGIYLMSIIDNLLDVKKDNIVKCPWITTK